METKQIAQLVESLGITMETKFVPQSRSRNAGEDTLSLNWKVKLSRNGRRFIETDYMQGIGHLAIDAKEFPHGTVIRKKAQKAAAETGKTPVKWMDGINSVSTGGNIPAPSILDVLHCLILDGGAIDYPTFEQWAADLGYDSDSRKAESIYRACLDTGLKLRSALGDPALQELREAFQDY